MKTGKKYPKNRKSGENSILGLLFSYFHSGTYFGTYLVSYFGPKAQNLFSSRPFGSQSKVAAELEAEKSWHDADIPPPPLAFEDDDNRIPVLLLHGVLGSHRNMQGIQDALTRVGVLVKPCQPSCTV